MEGYKAGSQKIKILKIGTTLICLFSLAAYGLDLSFPLPRFFMPERIVLALDADSASNLLANKDYKKLIKKRGVIMALADGAVTLRGARDYKPELHGQTPAKASFQSALPIIEQSAMPLRLYSSGIPSAGMVQSAKELYKRQGASLRFSPLSSNDSIVSALSVNLFPTENGSVLNMLFAPEALTCDMLTISLDNKTVWSGAGSGLPADRRLGFALQNEETKLQISHSSGNDSGEESFTLLSGMKGKEKVLICTGHPGQKSAIEAMLPSVVQGLDEFKKDDFYKYELLVLDGIELRSLGQDLESRLVKYVKSGAGSLLLSVDSADFGAEGDSPALEDILPLELSPRSTKMLPDIAMLIIIDVSGSMFGGKLSLAKATGLETISNLKDDDLIAILLFSENREWLYSFKKAKDAVSEEVLEPLKAGGGTKLYEALDEGLKSLANIKMPLKHIVLISDGISQEADFASIVAKARGENISISTIAVGDDFNRELLSFLSNASGGQAYVVSSEDEIPSIIFEDRQRVSRTVFSGERTAIKTALGMDAGAVNGMARFSTKPDSLVYFYSQPGDPLLASKSSGKRNVLLFTSDLHNTYTKSFFENSIALDTFRSIISNLLYEKESSLILNENADSFSVTISSRALSAPRLWLSDSGGRLFGPEAFTEGLPFWWTAKAPPLAPGSYTVLISDRGSIVARAASRINSGLSGKETSSVAAYTEYKTPLFCLFPSGPAWLIAFFISSLCLTLLLRSRQ